MATLAIAAVGAGAVVVVFVAMAVRVARGGAMLFVAGTLARESAGCAALTVCCRCEYGALFAALAAFEPQWLIPGEQPSRSGTTFRGDGD